MNWPLLQNSLLVAGSATTLAVTFGLVAALWLATLEARWRNVFLALAIVALAMPPFLVTNCWISLLGETGVLRSWLPFRIYSLGGTIWILALLLWPITLLATLAAWRSLEAAQFECEPAVTGFALLRWLLLPVAKGELALAAVLTFVLALNNFAVPAILQTKVLPDELWVQFNTTFFQKSDGNFDFGRMMQLSLPQVIAPVLLLAWAARRGARWPRVLGSVSARVVRRQLGGMECWSAGVVAVLLVVLSVGFPLGQIVVAKRTWAELAGAMEASAGAIWNSFWFAALAATVVVVIAIPLILRSAPHPIPLPIRWGEGDRRSREGAICRRFLTTAATTMGWLPFFIPGVLIGIALIKIFNRPPVLVMFYQSVGICLLALVIRYFALALTAARHAVASVDSDLTDAAKLEGASRWQMVRFVVWPQIAPQMCAAWYVVYLLCLWDVESIVLVQPPGGETLALKIFNLLHYGYAAQVSALCLILLVLAIAPLFVAIAFSQARQFFATPRSDFSRAIKIAAAVTVMAAVTSCSPQAPTHETSLNSHYFERAIVIGSRGVGIGEFNKPRSVAVDAQGSVYAVDMTGRVQKFSSDGKFLLSWQMPETTLGKAKGMGRDREGNILVVEPHYQRVNHFSPEGKLLAQWGCKGTQEGCLTLPRAVAVNSRGEIFVSEYQGVERIQRFAAPVLNLETGVSSRLLDPVAEHSTFNTQHSTFNDGPLTPALSPSDGERENRSAPALDSDGPRLLQVIGKAGTEAGEFNRPEGICVDAQDRIYVADSCNHRVQVFSSDGKFIRQYGKAGSGLGELSYPYDIAVDENGYQFVCEFGNSRIQVFNANCEPVEIIGGPGAAPGRFANPWGVALDSKGNLYVADSQNHRVQKLEKRKGHIGNSQLPAADGQQSASRITFHVSR
jgi:ABC-type Fe3+ transport system permease subunit/DNA-binding beta-propeller fold protein YncE